MPRRALLAVALAGCVGPPELGETATGVLRVFARSGSGGDHVASPDATFFRGGVAGFPDSRTSGDTCLITNLVTAPFTPPIDLDAGDSIAFTTGGQTAFLHPTTNVAGTRTYVVLQGTVSLTPGAPVTFEVPGAPGGFPETAYTALTAPAVTSVSPIPGAPPLDAPLTVTWGPAGDDSTRFELSLLYAIQGSSTLNRQLLCQWRDDGNAQIDASYLGEWTAAEIKQIEVSRYRTSRHGLADGVIYFLATFETVLPVAP